MWYGADRLKMKGFFEGGLEGIGSIRALYDFRRSFCLGFVGISEHSTKAS